MLDLQEWPPKRPSLQVKNKKEESEEFTGGVHHDGIIDVVRGEV